MSQPEETSGAPSRASSFIIWRPISHVTRLFRTPFLGFDNVIPLRRFTPLGARQLLQSTVGGSMFFRRVRRSERAVMRQAQARRIAQRAWQDEEAFFALFTKHHTLPATQLSNIQRFLEARPRSPLACSPMEECRAYLSRARPEDTRSTLNALRNIIEDARQTRPTIAALLLDESAGFTQALERVSDAVEVALSTWLELTAPVTAQLEADLDTQLKLFDDIATLLVPQPTADNIRWWTRLAQSVFFFLIRGLPFLQIDRWVNLIWGRYGWAHDEPGASFPSTRALLDTLRHRVEAIDHLPEAELLRALAASAQGSEEEAEDALVHIRHLISPTQINLFLSQKRSRPGHETFLGVVGRAGVDHQRIWFQEILVRAILPQSRIERLLDRHSVFVDLTNPSAPRVYDELGTSYPQIGRDILELYPRREEVIELRKRILKREQAWHTTHTRCKPDAFFGPFVREQLCYYRDIPESGSGILVVGAVRGDHLIRTLTERYSELLIRISGVVVEISDPNLRFHYRIPPSEADREQLTQVVRDALSVYLISDLHIGDGTETDVFDARKAASLRRLIEHIAQRASSLTVLGDFLDGLQRESLQAIIGIREELLRALRTVPHLTMIPGNHDHQLSAAEAQRIGRWMTSAARRQDARAHARQRTAALRETLTALTGAQFRELILDIDRGLALHHGHFSDKHNVSLVGRIAHGTFYNLAWKLGGRRAAERLEYYFSERLDQVLQRWWWPKATRTFERFFDRNMLLMEALDYLRVSSPLHRAYSLKRPIYTVGNGHTHLFEVPGDDPPIQLAMQDICDAMMISSPKVQKIDTGTWAGRRFKFNLRGVPIREDAFFSADTRDVIRFLLTEISPVDPKEWERQ